MLDLSATLLAPPYEWWWSDFTRGDTLDRCHQIGETAGLCAKRREVAWRVEEEMRRMRQAQHLARVRGFHILRKGHIMM